MERGGPIALAIAATLRQGGERQDVEPELLLRAQPSAAKQ